MTRQETSKQKEKNYQKKNRERKMRNAMRISIMLMAIGILILAVLVLVEFFGKSPGWGPSGNAKINQEANASQQSKLFSQQVVLSNFELSEDEINALKGKKIVIDAGHGGTDSGTIGPKTGVYESKLNMQVASSMEQVFLSIGTEVVMTRENTGTRENPSDKGLTWSQRGSAIQNAKADLLISIHHNFNESSNQIHGVQVLYRSKESENLAVTLQNTYNRDLNLQMDYLQEKYKVLSYGKQPGIIIEGGFLSNREEEKNIQTQEYQDWLVKTTVQAVADYFIQHP